MKVAGVEVPETVITAAALWMQEGKAFSAGDLPQVHCRGRWRAVKRKLQVLAAELGWRFVSHVTSQEARTPLGQLAYGFTTSGAAA